MGSSKTRMSDLTLQMLRALPRISLGNLKPIAGPLRGKNKRGRGQHGGDKHGCGNKGSGQRQNILRPGYELGNMPFYLRFPSEPYYYHHHLRRQYPPLSLLTLQTLIDTDRIDVSKPIDLTALCNTGVYTFSPESKHFGVNLTDEGADKFKAKVNLEIQWTTEPVIAAVEKNGGTITTAYFDPNALFILKDPMKFFERGEPIPRRMIPPQDAILYYTDPKHRGYLADPEKISWERLVLAQKYGYTLPEIEKDPDYEMLSERKDPRQIFYGLEPGWVINIHEKVILKPKDETLKEYYRQ